MLPCFRRKGFWEECQKILGENDDEIVERFQKAPSSYRDDKHFVEFACEQNSSCFQYAPTKYQDDNSIVCLVACGRPFRRKGSKIDPVQRACSFQFASERIRSDRNSVINLVRYNGLCLQHVSGPLKDDAEIVLEASKEAGDSFQYASQRLRSDMDFVQCIVGIKPHALKFALDGLHQNPQCLVAAGIWDQDDKQKVASTPGGLVLQAAEAPSVPRKRIVLSTRFSLSPKSSSQATEFTVLLKQHPYIRENCFTVYSPNAFDKSSCDPEWTRFDWPCRGTYKTCQFDSSMKSGVPTTKSCWRYSFRHQLEEASRSQGFMVQLVENVDQNSTPGKLGDGQTIERDMAKQMNVKVFEVQAPFRYLPFAASNSFRIDRIGVVLSRLMPEIQAWYQRGCTGMNIVTTSGREAPRSFLGVKRILPTSASLH